MSPGPTAGKGRDGVHTLVQLTRAYGTSGASWGRKEGSKARRAVVWVLDSGKDTGL